VIGNTYIYLIERFASDAGKKAGEFYTPKQVSRCWRSWPRQSPATASATRPAAPAAC
jgi:type I restriction enzyme M protein